jgi:hypothetical protein
MVQSAATTVEEYLDELPADRRETIEAVRQVILDNLPDGYEEGMSFGMIGYQVPLADFPVTYNGQPLGVVALANQKNYMTVYLMGVYGDDDERRWFEDAWRATGKRLDMGKSCVRFRHIEGAALDVLGEAVRRVPPDRVIAAHEAAHAGRRRKRR